MLDTLGARSLALGAELAYVPEAWEQVAQGVRPQGCDVAEAFFHLSRCEERGTARDRHDRFPASASCLDPLDPPLERLRARLGLEPPRWGDARFAVALTHDIDTPWRWTRIGLRGSAARLKSHALGRRGRSALHEARALAAAPWHKLRGTDPNWRFEHILEAERARGVSSTFFVMAGHRHPADGAAPEAYDRLRPRLVRTLLDGGGEVGLHGSYTAATDLAQLTDEKRVLEELAGPITGHRYHYLRVDVEDNLVPLATLGFRYDTSLGFADAPGFRAGIAHPFRPWDWAADAPATLIEIPLAVMDGTLGEERYLGLSARDAEARLDAIVDWAAEHGGGFSVLWHTDRFDPPTARGWDRLYYRFIESVQAAGGICLPASALAEHADAWLV
ncbi:MAG: polysaccharide deacetylase family protein [Gaiella sp.]